MKLNVFVVKLNISVPYFSFIIQGLSDLIMLHQETLCYDHFFRNHFILNIINWKQKFLIKTIYQAQRSLGNMSSLEKICAFDEISLFKLITAVQKLSIFFIANTRHYWIKMVSFSKFVSILAVSSTGLINMAWLHF